MSQLENPTSNDAVIVVMGLTGSGKSNFIARACNKGEKHVNHSIKCSRPNIRAVRTTHNNRSVVFVDTPGFDDDTASDTLALGEVADWLKKISQAKITFSAIIYLHRITDNRMSGPSREHLKTFASLCGATVMPNVILVTTMWDHVKKKTGEAREEELKTDFWAEMRADGCRTGRFQNTHDSAWEVIGNFPDCGTRLQFHEEVVQVRESSRTRVFGRLRTPKWLADLKYALGAR